MKLLVINPTTTAAFTDEMLEVARAAALPGTEIDGCTANQGVASIDGYFEDTVGAKAVTDAIREHDGQYDAFVVGCFSDAGVPAARQLTETPVVGIAEASFALATSIGHRFSLLTNLEQGVPLLLDLVDQLGRAHHLASVRSTELSVLNSHLDPEATLSYFLPAAERAVREDRADVLCLACGVVLGVRERIEEQLGVPVIDAVPVGITFAESLVRLGYRTSKRRAYKPSELIDSGSEAS